MVEFAFASLVLIPMFVGTFQFGSTFYVHNLLCTQTRAAARYASIKTFKCSSESKEITAWKTSVSNMMRFGNPDGSGTMIEPGLTGAYLALFSEIGIILLVTTLAGALGGHWVDLQLGVTPLFLLVGLLGGLAAGALVVYRLISRFLASFED